MGKINYTLLNASVLNASRLNMTGEIGKPGGGAGGYWPAGTPAAIRRSAVLWYDIAKQGATNETMAANPVLKDLSGHGHDATCYNFGWEGMSGVGGYAADFSKSYSQGITVIERTYKILHFTTTGACWPWFYLANEFSTKPFSVKVSGLNGHTLSYYYYDGTIRKSINITSDGIWEIPESIFYAGSTETCGFCIRDNEQSLNVTIEQLPLYPGALVSDGVDDYAYVDGLPILTPERGYTIIAKRERIVDDAERLVTALFSKGRNLNVNNDTGVVVEISRMDTNRCISFDRPTNVEFSAQNIIYQTSTKYNATELTKGESDDHSDILVLNKIEQSASNCLPAALYSLLLFDRDLTDEEIEWVKANIMADPEPEPTPELDASLVDAWIFSGYRNEDVPKSVTGEKGHALALGNFAYAEGSGFADGRLVTDGVDDYAENLDMPALTDYTFITRRTLMNFEAYASVASKAYGAGSNGAFLFECRDLSTSGPVPDRTASFGAIKEGTFINNAIPEEVSWQTKTSYNGKTLSPGNLADGNLFYLASTRATGNCVAAKFAWCALYDRSLTEEEINAEVAKLDALWEARKV